MLPPVVKPGGLSLERIFELFPNLKERLGSSQGTKLSGGEQQMLAIARILRTGARLLLLDEPTEGLAPVIIQQIGNTIRTLKSQGFTILLVEQNFRFAATVADRYYVMEHGRVVDKLLSSELEQKSGKASRLSRRITASTNGRRTNKEECMKRLSRHAMGVAALAAALGCGTAHAQFSDGVIKIGVMNDMSGTYSDLSGQGSVIAARMAVEDFGAAAKGMKVEIVGADHQNKPDVGSNVVRTWIDVDKVDAIVDVPTSSVALAVNQIVKEKNKVFLVSGAAASDLTGKACTPNTIHWTYDTWALANGTGNAIVKTGGDTWFFLTADYAFGHALERDTSAVVEKNGGKVVGKVRHPFPGQDFSSFLLQAQASKAKIIGLANAGSDTTNAIKQAAEFGIVQGGQNLAGAAGLHHRRECAGSEDGAGPGHDRGLVLGPERQQPRIHQEIHRAEQGLLSDDGACRRVFGGHALSEGAGSR